MAGRGPLVTKLSLFVPLSDEDVRVLDGMCLNEERFKADTDIVREGDVPRSAFVLTRGMAFRYRLMPDGKRQILLRVFGRLPVTDSATRSRAGVRKASGEETAGSLRRQWCRSMGI